MAGHFDSPSWPGHRNRLAWQCLPWRHHKDPLRSRVTDNALFPVECATTRRPSIPEARAHEDGVHRNPIAFEARSASAIARCCTPPMPFPAMTATRARHEAEQDLPGTRNAPERSSRTPGRQPGSLPPLFGGMRRPPGGPIGTAVRASLRSLPGFPHAVPASRTNPAGPSSDSPCRQASPSRQGIWAPSISPRWPGRNLERSPSRPCRMASPCLSEGAPRARSPAALAGAPEGQKLAPVPARAARQTANAPARLSSNVSANRIPSWGSNRASGHVPPMGRP